MTDLSFETIDGTTQAGASRSGRGGAVKSIAEDPSLEPIRFLFDLAVAGGDKLQAKAIGDSRWPNRPMLQTVQKAAIAAGSSTGETWAGPLASPYRQFTAAFIEFLRPRTILGQFGRKGLPALTKVPFLTSIPRQTSGAEGYWVREGHAKPLTAWSYDLVSLELNKVANICVFTDELVRSSSIDALMLGRNELAAALTAVLDKTFIDPAIGPVAGLNPGSVTYGVTPIASVGADADAIREDVKAVYGKFIAQDNAPTSGVWIMQQTTALAVSLMVNALGQAEFPGITMFGGTFFGLPVITSQHVTPGVVALVNANDVLVADDGHFEIDVSREASLQMESSPTNTSVGPDPTPLVSLWQTNSVGVRCERFISWTKRRASAVAYLSGVSWGGAVSS